MQSAMGPCHGKVKKDAKEEKVEEAVK